MQTAENNNDDSYVVDITRLFFPRRGVIPMKKLRKRHFSTVFSELSKHWANIMYRPHILTMGLRVPACGGSAVGGKLDKLLISAHLLHIGRQRKSRRQKHFLFIHHFGLTWSVVEGALKTDKQQCGLSCDWNKLALWAWTGLGKE